MGWDWLSPAVSGAVGVAGLYFGWLSGKQSRDHAERLARHNDEHARLMAEQRDTHARTLEEDRRLHELRMGEEERRQQRLAEAYLEIMTTVVRASQVLRSDDGSTLVRDDLVRATALAETFASPEVLGLFESWRDLVYRVLEADTRMKANADAEEAVTSAMNMRSHWHRQARDLRLREADQRRALADAVSAELRPARHRARLTLGRPLRPCHALPPRRPAGTASAAMKGKRLLVLGTAVTMAVLGSGSTAWAEPAHSGAPGITWGTCSNAGLQKAGAQCGFLSVPLDYSHPNGTKIQLAVSRIKHKTPDSQFQGVLLANPGGPGGAGLTLSRLGEFVPGHAGDSYDWIGFDPRGVGSSKPALSCIPDYFGPNRPDYIPSTRSLEKTWLARSKAYATACGTNGGALLDHMTTIDAVKDMDGIRAALGQRQINFFGFSYGTYLGQVYSTLYPQRVRRMVLDSNVDPRKVWYQANLDQDTAFQKTIEIWFGWLARYDSVYHLGTTASAVERLWYSEQRKLRANPAGGVVGPDEWTDIFLLAGYYQSTWLDLGAAFAGWVHNRDAGPIVDWYNAADGPGDDNGFAVYAAVQCTDAQWPTDWDRWRADNWRTFRRAPFETWGNAWFNAPCVYWPARAHRPVDVDGRHVASVLLIDETLDAATPFEGSLEVRRRYPHASLIAEPGGTTHAGSLSGNACVDNQIAAYLATGKLPKRLPGNRADTLCDPLPQPDPTAAAPSAAVAVTGSARPLPHARL